MATKNYVSVTAGVDYQEVSKISALFKAAGYTMESEHVPAIGFLVSQRTVHYPETKARNLRFPIFKEIPNLIHAANNEILTVMHYNPNNDQPASPEALSEQVINALQSFYSQRLCHTVQLNGKSLHDIKQVRQIKEHFEDLDIILQVSAHAMKALTASDVARRISRYNDSINYVLIDPSRGRGIEFDVGHSSELFDAIKSLPTDYSVVFAGGLSGNNVERYLCQLVDRIGSTDFSIDAESRLRNKINGFFGQDILNLDKVREYIKNSAKVLSL